MKLKQRVVMTGSLCLVMSTLFIIGTHIGWRTRAEDAVNRRGQQNQANPRGPDGQRKTDAESEKKPEVLSNRPVPVGPPRGRPDLGLPELPRDRPGAARMLEGKSREELLKMWRNRTAGVGGRDLGADGLPRPRVPPPQELSREVLGRLNRHRLDHGKAAEEEPGRPEDALNRVLNDIHQRSPEMLNRQRLLRGGVGRSDAQVPTEDANKGLNKVSISEIPDEIARTNPWEIWRRWVRQDQLYPEGIFWSDQMNHILNSMATASITSFGVGYKGTQLKASVQFGKQRAAFKPMRYPRQKVIDGDPYGGHDRHNGEIAGFHLDGILGFNMAPPVVGRRINLTALRPVTSEKLLSTYVEKDGNTCFYGKCSYCKPEKAACAEGEIMEGSVTIWLPEWHGLKTWRHPWQRTYRKGVKAEWEKDHGYCKTYLDPSSEYYHGLLEITDASVYDFLMGNADRHDYETYEKAPKHGKMLHMDNGKTFGNPYHDEQSILAPLMQCCRLRNSTWIKLNSLYENGPLSEVLDRSMRRDPVYPILTQEHLTAIDRRLSIVIHAVHQCFQSLSRDTVIVSSWGD